MSRIFDLMILNILFLLLCLPIITIGANITAMYYVTLKMIKNEESYVIRSYWKSFRQNFRQATILWLILLLFFVFLLLDLSICRKMTGAMAFLRYFFLFMLLLYGAVVSYVFPVLSRFDNTVKNTIRNALLMAIRHLPWTVCILLVNFSPLLVFLFAPSGVLSWFLLFLLLLGFSTIAFANSWFFVNKIFPYYMPKEEEGIMPCEENSPF